ncbi:phage tail protein [Marinomonas mediterranea]|uniref:phage tail protein n=1 Tax=Marinomonas mediterranea TaxID=119864 RepID=UPI00234ABB9B|nr:tail fiber protein [Marinomonas mediterranea]WCN08585.1 hypothetical protein GV055_06405 [Marinomonas mediterranea]WCN12639.1 hypothetical protein GV054_06245 [Marinomonas mediterranea]
MSDPFYGEIRIFGFNFAPVGWALCDGATIAISSNQALFSLLGTAYGGDGRSTFGLPDLQGRTPIHSGPVNNFERGIKTGYETITLTSSEVGHTHDLQASYENGTDYSVSDGVFAESVPYGSFGSTNIYGPANSLTPLRSDTCSAIGGGQSHNNIQPSIVMNFCIATTGIYPSRN